MWDEEPMDKHPRVGTRKQKSLKVWLALAGLIAI